MTKVELDKLKKDPEKYKAFREKANAYEKKWLEAHPEHRKKKILKNRKFRYKNYNFTVEEYDAMWDEQKGRCAFCGGSMTKWKKGMLGPVVDHCHTTNKVRGIVHNRCNLIVGMFENNPNILKNAPAYIAKYKKS